MTLGRRQRGWTPHRPGSWDMSIRTSMALLFFLLAVSLSVVHAQPYWLSVSSPLATYRVAVDGSVVSLMIKNQSGEYETASGLSFKITQLREVAPNGTVLQQIDLNPSLWNRTGTGTLSGQQVNQTTNFGVIYFPSGGPIVSIAMKLVPGNGQ